MDRNPSVLRSLATYVVLLFGISAFLAYFLGDRSSDPIRFVMPVGYEGHFRLVLDKERGVSIRRSDGVYVIRIPESGILSVSDFKPFRAWHAESARYADGQPIPLSDDAPALELAEIALFPLSSFRDSAIGLSSSREEMWFFVGTRANLAAARAEMEEHMNEGAP